MIRYNISIPNAFLRKLMQAKGIVLIANDDEQTFTVKFDKHYFVQTVIARKHKRYESVELTVDINFMTLSIV